MAFIKKYIFDLLFNAVISHEINVTFRSTCRSFKAYTEPTNGVVLRQMFGIFQTLFVCALRLELIECMFFCYFGKSFEIKSNQMTVITSVKSSLLANIK